MKPQSKSFGTTHSAPKQSVWLDVPSWMLIAAALFVLVYRSYRFGGYFPDDAYITFRFAEHLANGLGIVWNEGGPRVEGATSFLQTLLAAAGFRLGMPVNVIAHTISALAVAGMVFTFYRISVRLTGGFALAMALPLALFISSIEFSIHVNSGMDTIVSAALLATSFLCGLWVLARPGWAAVIVLALVNFLCLWCRPDGAPYLIGQGLVLFLAAFYRARRDDAGFLFKLLTSFALLVAMGLVFLAWKLSYFGYALPNSFYVKASAPWSFSGLDPVVLFLTRTFRRGAFLIPLLLFVDWKSLRARIDAAALDRVALLVVPVVCFLAYNTTVAHIVNFSSRFEFPIAGFLWIGLGWMMSAGRASERLQAAIRRLRLPLIGYGAAGIALVFIFAVPLQLDRSQHSRWFSYMQKLHYEPVAAALVRSGGGKDITLVYDAAGYIAFDSKVSFLDPVGLCDNVLSGRVPLSPLEREKYIWGSHPDVYLGPVPPATIGAATAAEEPLFDTDYARKILLNRDTFADYGHFMDEMTETEEKDAMHFRMRELRDNWIAVGEIPYPFGAADEYTHFVYVRADSPFADRLVAEFSKVTTRELEMIDFNNVTEGQVPLTMEQARALSAMR